jgi:hypothetical protein
LKVSVLINFKVAGRQICYLEPLLVQDNSIYPYFLNADFY